MARIEKYPGIKVVDRSFSVNFIYYIMGLSLKLKERKGKNEADGRATSCVPNRKVAIFRVPRVDRDCQYDCDSTYIHN